MGKNPCSIFRELYIESTRKQDKIASIPEVVKSRIHLMSEEDIKLQYITPALTSKWPVGKITM